MNTIRICSLAIMVLCGVGANAADAENKLIGTWEGKLKKHAIVVAFVDDGRVSILVDGAPARADMTFMYVPQSGTKGIAAEMPSIRGAYTDGRKGGLKTGIIQKDEETILIGLPEDFGALIPSMEQVELKRKK